MDADTRAVDTHPRNAYRAVGTRRQHERILAPHATFENGLIPTKMRKQEVADDFPSAKRDRDFCGAWCAGEATDNATILVEFDQTFRAKEH